MNRLPEAEFSEHFYAKCHSELLNLIPKYEYEKIMNQPYCELDCTFLGFLEIYKSLSLAIPRGCIIIDLGCYVAAQSYFFREHRKYIGVDVVDLKRFSPPNAEHYVMDIQEFVKDVVPELFREEDPLKYVAVCSYVPDSEATALVRAAFPNVMCYYPSK